MFLDLHKFYHYIFGDWANVDAHIKTELKDTYKDKLSSTRKAEIKKFFFEPAEKNTLPLISEPYKSLFRAALRTINAAHLEKILFDNAADELKETYTFPDDKKIEELFNHYENEFHYFSESTTKAIEQFKKFFKVTKLIGDLVEINNDLNNSIAALHAYKLTAIFGNNTKYDFQPIDTYLKQFNYYKFDHPLHDALIYPIPKQEEKAVFHLGSWRTIIQQSGSRAFQLFDMAAAIERQLTKPPENFAIALETAKKLRYKNSEQNPLLADLCFQYHRSEKMFERCLQIEKKCKSKDNLPKITVDGAEINKPGYHLVKLPIDDPRAYLLGELTNCCQSIGGHSEQCVIDGVTLENNGFYVLLKPIKEPCFDAPLDEKGNINYKKYEIIGQGYAWISQQGNLTFDSWENLTPSRDDQVIIPMLEKFSQKITHAKEFDFVRVTIGTGGKTPENLKFNTTKFQEKILEGTQYVDSLRQATLYCNENKRKLLISKLEEIIFKIIFSDVTPKLSEKKSEFVKMVTEPCFSSKYIDKSQQVLESKEMQLFLKARMNSQNFPPAAVSYYHGTAVFPWDDLMLLHDHKLLTDEIWNEYEDNPVNLNNIINAAQLLQKIEWGGDPSFRNIIFRNANKTETVANAYAKLKEMKLDNDSSVRTLFMKNPVYAGDYLEGYEKLVKNSLEQDEEMRRHMLRYPDSAKEVANGLCILKEFNNEDNYKIRRCMLENRFQAERIANAFATIIKKNKKNQYEKFIYQYPFNANQLILAFIELDEMQLKNDGVIRKKMLKSPEESANICEAFSLLKANNLEDHPEIRKHILESLVTFYGYIAKANLCIYAHKKLVEHKLDNVPHLRKLVFSHPREADAIIDGYLKLQQFNVEESASVYHCINSFPGYAREIVDAFVKLKEIHHEEDKFIWDFAAATDYHKFVDKLKSIVTIMYSLTKLKLDNDKDIHDYLFDMDVWPACFPDTLDTVLSAFKMVTSENIPIDDKIKNAILDNPGEADKIALGIIYETFKAPKIGIFSVSSSEADSSAPIIQEHKKR